MLTTWTADYPTPGAFLVPLVDGRSIRGRANTNYARLNVPEINALIDQARAAGDTPEGRACGETSRQRHGTPRPTCRWPRRACSCIAGQRLRNGLVMQPYGGYDLATAGVE